MPASSILQQLLAYLPPDRAEAILTDVALPEKAEGAVLFSDISGFTPLTEAVFARFGPRRGGEYFTDRLNAVYAALISEVVRFGGSIVGFAGDAMFVWFAGDDGARAATTAVYLQRAMEQFARVELPDGSVVSLGMKVAVATGKVSRFAVGDPRIQRLDIVAGAVMEHVTACEGVAARGEIVVDGETARRLGAQLAVKEWRQLPPGAEPVDVAVIASVESEVSPQPRPVPALPPDASERLLPWLVPEVGRRIVSGQDVFLTELRPATVLFASFSGIDFAGDPAAPEKFDRYVRWLQRVIDQLEGVLLQFIIGEKGNYFYAAWGAPIAHDDDTMRACTAALEMVRPPAEIDAFLGSTQVGITRGTLRTGAYGSRLRRTYGVMGDDTNLAARLMTKAAPGEILVSSQAARRQTDMFELEDLPPVLVKGKKEPIPVFRLLSRKQTGILSANWSARHSTPMIGRKSELARALERLQRARDGSGQVIALSADAGMGKTRLLTEVVSEAGALGFAAFAGDCPVLAREASYSVWIPIWRSFFQIPPGTDAAETLAIVERQLVAQDPELRQRAPLLGPLLNVQLPENDLTQTLDAKVRRASLEGLVIECIRHRVRSSPLLFVLEECHWIDEASRSLLASLVRAAARFPLAIVLAHRPVKAGDLFGATEYALDYVTTIQLGNMPNDEARQLVAFKLAEAFGPDSAPEPLVELITSRADGNPFFIEEVVNLLKTRGTNPRDARAVAHIDLPESLHSLVLGRIDQLSEDARSTLKVASVIGRQFRTAVLFGVHPLERVRSGLPAQLQEMQTRDIALPEPVDGEDAYLFKHIVIQEVAYESLPFTFRATIHETIGGYLERLAGDQVRPWLDLLAFHFDRGNSEEKKRHYLVAAGDAARAAYALPSASSYYERALSLLTGATRADVLARFGEVLELSGRWNEAFGRYHEAREQAERVGQPTQRAAMAGAIGDLHRKRGEFLEAQTWIELARQENADIGNDAGVALMLHLQGTLSAQTGKFPRAAELYEQALAIRERLGADADAARTLNNLGIVSRAQGAIETALTFYERSLAIRRRLNDRREIANSLNNLGFIQRFRKEFDRARESLEESVQLNRAVGDRWSTANALSSLAELALDTGDAELAHRCLKDSITINRELGDRRALAFLLEGFGRWARLRGTMAVALLFFAAARALRETIGAPLEPADAQALAAVVAQTRETVAAEDAERAETDGRTLPLADVLDRAMATKI